MTAAPPTIPERFLNVGSFVHVEGQEDPGVVAAVDPRGFTVWTAKTPERYAGAIRQAEQLEWTSVIPKGGFDVGDEVEVIGTRTTPGYRTYIVRELVQSGQLVHMTTVGQPESDHWHAASLLALIKRRDVKRAKFALVGRDVPEPEVAEPAPSKAKKGKKAHDVAEQDVEAAIAQTYRVTARFPDGTVGLGVVRTGAKLGKDAPHAGKYSVTRELDDEAFIIPPADVTPAPGLKPGDRVREFHCNGGKRGTITNLRESADGKLVHATITFDDGSTGGSHVANIVRLLDDTDVTPTDAPPTEAPRTHPSVPSLTPGTLGLVEAPLSQLVKSPCNVRHHYDAAATLELAASLAAQGQQQNGTGRWNADGQIEVIAGESRRRAWQLLVERGDASPDQPYLIKIGDFTDAQALEISATENMARRRMTPLEECDAMHRLVQAGRAHEEIAALFGYKSTQPVHDRVLAATNLHEAARAALDEGRISLAHAFVIARAPGADFQKVLVDEARYRSAKDLADSLTRGQFLVKSAKFDVDKSGLDVISDLFGTFEPYFQDKKAALAKQVEHANALAGKARKTGHWDFVDVGTSLYPNVYDGKYDGYVPDRGGLVLLINRETGELRRFEHVKLKGAKQPSDAGGSAAAPASDDGRGISGAAHIDMHTARALALREALLGDTHRTLALTVHALIASTDPSQGRASLHPLLPLHAPIHQHGDSPLKRAAERVQDILGGFDGQAVRLPFIADGLQITSAAESAALYDRLVVLTTEQLLDILNVLVTCGVYQHPFRADEAPAPLYVKLAAETNAAAILARDFKLSDLFLKRLPPSELFKLAEEARIPREMLEGFGTQKEMRAVILEHGKRLREEGFVPSIARFPEVAP